MKTCALLVAVALALSACAPGSGGGSSQPSCDAAQTAAIQASFDDDDYFPETKVAIAVIVDSDKGPGAGFPFAPTCLGDLYMTLRNPYFGTTR